VLDGSEHDARVGLFGAPPIHVLIGDDVHVEWCVPAMGACLRRDGAFGVRLRAGGLLGGRRAQMAADAIRLRLCRQA
jgi:hypothetical protein